ncbi:MAG: hypothetical protein IK063_02035, partial [Clostridia bacterium]|nr:hypothetical protein [Clostridia bacterium]
MKIFNKKNFIRALSAVLSLTLVSLVAFSPLPVSSAQESLDDLKKQYSDLEKDVAANEKKLKQVESQIATNEEKLKTITSDIETIKSQIKILDQRIDVLDGSISQLRPQISALNKQIGNVEDSIDKLSAQIEETQQLAQETQDKLLERIREDYMAGGNATMIEVLLSSEDLSTFLARMELMDRVSESDEQLIKDMEQKADELNSLKEEAAVQKADLQIKKGLLDSKMGELRSNQYDLESSRSAASSKQAALDNRYEQVNEVLSELDEDSEAYQKEIARQRAEMEVLSKEIDNYIAQNGSSQGEEVPEEYLVSRKSANLIWPVPYNNTHVTCHFGYYSNGQPHYGTDIVVRDANGNNISNGKTIVAAQSGKV